MSDLHGKHGLPPAVAGEPGKREAATAASEPPRRWCEHEDGPCQMCKEIGARVVRSEELLQGSRELFIVHGSQVYRLLRTRNDKLILQK